MLPRIVPRRFSQRMRDVAPNRRWMRDKRRRDVTPSTTASPNAITPSQAMTQFGWIGPVISAMGDTARWAVSLNPDNMVVSGQGYPLETLATSPGALLNACEIACQGAAGKTATAGVWAAATLDLALTANTSNAFGAYIRISNSITSFKFATYELMFATGATVASAISYVWVNVTTLPCEIVILGINNAAGKATIVPNTTPNVVVPYSAVAGAIGNINAGSFAAGDVIYAETLNMRDIGNIVDAVEGGAILL